MGVLPSQVEKDSTVSKLARSVSCALLPFVHSVASVRQGSKPPCGTAEKSEL